MFVLSFGVDFTCTLYHRSKSQTVSRRLTVSQLFENFLRNEGTEMPRRFGGGNMINRRGGSRTARFTNELSHRFDGPPRTSVPTVVISKCILVRATNDMPNCFNGPPRTSVPTVVISNRIRCRATKNGRRNASPTVDKIKNYPFFKSFCGVLGELFSKSSPNVPPRSPYSS